METYVHKLSAGMFKCQSFICHYVGAFYVGQNNLLKLSLFN